MEIQIPDQLPQIFVPGNLPTTVGEFGGLSVALAGSRRLCNFSAPQAIAHEIGRAAQRFVTADGRVVIPMPAVLASGARP